MLEEHLCSGGCCKGMRRRNRNWHATQRKYKEEHKNNGITTEHHTRWLYALRSFRSCRHCNRLFYRNAHMCVFVRDTYVLLTRVKLYACQTCFHTAYSMQDARNYERTRQSLGATCAGVFLTAPMHCPNEVANFLLQNMTSERYQVRQVWRKKTQWQTRGCFLNQTHLSNHLSNQNHLFRIFT